MQPLVPESGSSRRVVLNILVTGSKGFIGKNLCLYLTEFPNVQVDTFDREDSEERLVELLLRSDVIVHLAGENRPQSAGDFELVNTKLTQLICKILGDHDSGASILLASSTHALLDTEYGRSKLAAEEAVVQLNMQKGNSVAIYRLPSIFGKWCRPNYNSVVATFCHNLANDMPIRVDDENTLLTLAHIDDLISSFVQKITNPPRGLEYPRLAPEYQVTIGAIAAQLQLFQTSRNSLLLDDVGTGFERVLYSTYISYLPKDKFSYKIPMHEDSRGVFVEFFKNNQAGQFSFLTANSGVTRGSHYHHTKTEKFVVIKGQAQFGFRNLITNETHYLATSGDESKIVETIPGWAHEITNIGSKELIVLVWANEIYNRQVPDTVISEV